MKVEKPMSGTEFYYRTILTSIGERYLHRQKIHIFAYRGLPWVPCYTFLESSHPADFKL